MADRFPLILNTSTNQIQEIPSGDNLDLTGTGINNAGIITAGNVTIGAATTDLVVNGDARITGILTIGTSSLKLDGPNNLVNVGTALTLGHTQGLQFHTQNLHSAGFEVNQVNASGIITATGADINGNIDVTGAITATGTITSNDITIQDQQPRLNFIDNAAPSGASHNPDYLIQVDGGTFVIHDSTNARNSFRINPDGHVDIPLNCDFGAGIDVTGNATVSGNLSVGGVLTYEDVTNVDSVGLVTARDGVFLPDLKQLKLGNTAAAPDLYIWHNSGTNNSNISNKTGDLFIQGNNGSGTLVNQIAVKSNAAVELNYQGNKKFETTSYGVLSNESLKVEGDYILVNNGGDSSYRLGKGNTSLFSIRNNSTSGVHLNTQNNAILAFGVNSGNIPGTVNSDLQILAGGFVRIPNDSGKFQLGASQDLEIFHTGSASKINNATGSLFIQSDAMSFHGNGGSETMATFAKNGAVELYHDNLKRFETSSTGAIISGPSNTTCTFQIVGTEDRSAEIRLIADDGDDYTDTVRLHQSVNGNFYLQNLTASAQFENMFVAIPNGGLQLYHDNSIRIETLAEGAKVKRYGGGATTLYIEGPENQNAILDMFADDGDDNQDKFRLTATTGGVFFLQNYANGSWHNNIGSTGGGSVDLYHNNTKRLETTSSGAKITGDLTLNHSSDSTDVTGYAVQRIWAPTISAGNVYKCGQWYEGEGVIQLFISVRSVQGGHSGTATYLFQGGFAAVSGIQRLLPMASGRGHGDNADTGMNSNAWEVLIHNINNYTYALYIHVPSGRTGKILQVSVTEMNRGNTFTDLSSTVAYSSITVNSGNLTSLQTSHAEVVRQHLLPAFKVGRGGSDQNVNTGDAIKFNYTSGSSQFFNQGNHYNSSTGYFTAPYAGVYHFYALIIFEQVSENTDMTDSWDFYQNNTQIAFSARRAKYRGDYTGTSGYFTDPATVTTYMNAGDYVWCRNKYNSKVIHSNPTYSFFCGHFCG